MMASPGSDQGGGYHERVRELFATPAHAGDLEGGYPVTVSGEAAESANGCSVRLAAGLDGGVVREIRYRVFGCPHLIAAAEEWCLRIEGGPAHGAPVPTVPELMAALGVPVEKTGRLLLLEDAWLALMRALQREPNALENDQL